MTATKHIIEPFDLWESLMADISHKLLIKYGLAENPTREKTEEWVKLTEELIRSGYQKEQAGTEAARKIFRDFKTRFYASEADTIEMLLHEAAKK
jgi:hypothetical protein